MCTNKMILAGFLYIPQQQVIEYKYEIITDTDR